jgi:hypothetical protein
MQRTASARGTSPATSRETTPIREDAWERMGMPADECCAYALASPSMIEFRRMLFSKIVPNVKKLGLLDDWLRARFAELDILKYEDLAASDDSVFGDRPDVAL